MSKTPRAGPDPIRYRSATAPLSRFPSSLSTVSLGQIPHPDLQLFDRTFFSQFAQTFQQDRSRPDLDVPYRQMTPIFQFLSRLHQLSPSKSIFGSALKGPERTRFIEQFATRFAIYVRSTENEIGKMQQKVSLLPHPDENFLPGWQARVRNAAYLAFVSQYGQERKSEVDEHGMPAPYIQHPFRASFDVQIGQLGPLREETTEATLLHDVPEDIDKSFLVKYSGFSPDGANALVFDFIQQSVQVHNSKRPDILSVSKLVKAVDKKRAMEILGREPLNRTEVLMCLLYGLAKMPTKDFVRYAPHIITIKLSDRADNGRTIKSLDPKRFSAIWLETCFVYLWLARQFEMNSCVEMLLDLLQHVQSDERERTEASRDSHEQAHQLPAKFRNTIYEKMSSAGFKKEDVHIDFRPRGIRYVNKTTPHDQLFSSPHSEDHSIGFNNFINLIPTCSDPARNSQLAALLASILHDLFPRSVDGIFDEQKTHFGKHYKFLTDLPDDALSVKDLPPGEQKFGYVVARVFADYSDFILKNYGQLHGAVLLKDRKSLKSVGHLQSTLSSYAEIPVQILREIDDNSDSSFSPGRSPNGVSRSVKKRVDATLQDGHVRPSRKFTAAEQQELRTMTYALFYDLFGARKRQVTLVDLKRNPTRYLAGYAPKDAPLAASLLVHNLMALVSKPTYAETDGDPHKDSNADVWDDQDFSLIEVPEDYSATPFGSVGDMLRYDCDESVPDLRLAQFLRQELEKGVRRGLERVVAEGHIQGDVPDRVAQIGMDYQNGLV